MSVLGDKLRAHAAGMSRRECVIEFGDEAVTVFSSPLSGQDVDRMLKKYPGFTENPTIEAIIDLIISKVETESGDKAFGVEDKPILRRLPLSMIHHIRNSLFEDDQDFSDARIEEDEKN